MMLPQCFTRYDWCRSYVLSTHVRTAIPRTGSVGMLGAHNAARGLLVEFADTPVRPGSYWTTARPRSRIGDVAVEVTATARHPDGAHLVVATTALTRRRPPDRVGDWTLRIDGVHQVEQDRA